MRPKCAWASATASRRASSSRTSATNVRHCVRRPTSSRSESSSSVEPIRYARVLERLGDVERDDVVAVLGQRERDGAALAVGGAGDQRDRAHAA